MHNKYDEYYEGITQTFDIYDSFLTKIEIAVKESVEASFTGSLEIDNSNTERIYPKITYITEGVPENTVLVSGKTEVKAIETISFSEYLILDFEEQIYEADGENVIDKLEFSDNELFYLEEDDDREIDLYGDGTIEYYEYPSVTRERFVQDFGVDLNIVWNNSRTKKIDENYNVSMGRFDTTNFNILEHLQDGKKFRIKYRNVDLEDYEEHNNYLLEVTIGDWDHRFSETGDVIMSNISGEAENLI